MKLPRDVSGERLANALCRDWGYRKVHQVGSHVVLETDRPSHQRVVVPAHKSLRIGTFSAILRAVARHKGVSRWGRGARDVIRNGARDVFRGSRG